MLAEQNVTARVLLNRYARLAKRVAPASIRRTVRNDADEDHMLACALAAGEALAIVERESQWQWQWQVIRNLSSSGQNETCARLRAELIQ